MNILLDTNAYVAFKHGDDIAFSIIQQVDQIGLSVIVIGELLSGFRSGKCEKRNRQELNEFMVSPRVKILSIDENTALYYSLIYYQLKEKGKPIPSNDLWIAATTLQNGLPIFTFDHHFTEIDGLLVVNTPDDII